MSLSTTEQFAELSRESHAPIILLPKYPGKDILASAFALARFFSRSGKSAAVAGEGVSSRRQELDFLAAPETLLDSLSGTRDFILSFNTEHNKILSTRSEQVGDEFRILITPEHGSIDPRDFSFIPARFQYDAAFVLGSPDRESLGTLYEESADIFYEIPIVNIDTRAENEHFGQLNIVELTASSVAEILYDLLSATDRAAIDDGVAEGLLAGIIAATESFQKKNTTPKSLQTASSLIELGADREKIVLSLYKTQPFHLLKLWGRLMSELKWEESLRLAYVSATLDDFVQSRSKPDDLPFILDKIRGNFSSAAFLLVLAPDSSGTSRAALKAGANQSLSALLPRIPDATLVDDTLFFPVGAAVGDEGETLAKKILGDAVERK